MTTNFIHIPMKQSSILILICVVLSSFSVHASGKFNVKSALNTCDKQVHRTLQEIGDTTLLPNNISKDMSVWKLSPIDAWTSGFWPGILWYDYAYTKNESLKKHAIHFTELLQPLSMRKARDHDLGFQIFCSYGNAYKLTKNPSYKNVVLRTADSLAMLFNSKVGTICSWPGFGRRNGWPHNTIIDNMMNLEMLFWAAKNGGNPGLYDLAVSHANVTMNNHFRQNGSCYHVAVYDTVSGKFIKGLTHQGYTNESFWARGQAWAIYGYTVAYRETGDKTYLRFAEKITDIYLTRLPDDFIPYWDFDAPNIPNEPRDASAAAITASALLELSCLEDNKTKAKTYKTAAVNMLKVLSSKEYQSGNSKPSFLLHSTGHKPDNHEVDASLSYADYYYIEALFRYWSWF